MNILQKIRAAMGKQTRDEKRINRGQATNKDNSGGGFWDWAGSFFARKPKKRDAGIGGFVRKGTFFGFNAPSPATIIQRRQRKARRITRRAAQ